MYTGLNIQFPKTPQNIFNYFFTRMNEMNEMNEMNMFQMDTMSMPASRGASAFGGTRPTSPHVTVNVQQQPSSYSHPVRQQQLNQQLLQQQHMGRLA